MCVCFIDTNQPTKQTQIWLHHLRLNEIKQTVADRRCCATRRSSELTFVLLRADATFQSDRTAKICWQIGIEFSLTVLTFNGNQPRIESENTKIYLVVT